MRIQECRKCGNGYYVALYHEKRPNVFTKVGANCNCERSTIDLLWVDELVAEYRGDVTVDNCVLPMSYLG